MNGLQLAKKIAIYTQTKVYHTYGTVKEFAASFEKYPNFFRCHQSVLVNKIMFKG